MIGIDVIHLFNYNRYRIWVNYKLCNTGIWYLIRSPVTSMCFIRKARNCISWRPEFLCMIVKHITRIYAYYLFCSYCSFIFVYPLERDFPSLSHGSNFGTLMYLNHFLNWLNFGHDLSVLILAKLWLNVRNINRECVVFMFGMSFQFLL